MRFIDSFKRLVKENNQFIYGIMFTGGVALGIYLLRNQIVFLGRSFWTIADVFALPVTILIVYWLYQKKEPISKNRALTMMAPQPESQWLTDWRRDLKAIVAKDKLTLDDVYSLRASVGFAPKSGENLTSYETMSNEIIEFCDNLVAKRQDNEAEVVWLKEGAEREAVRVYSRYLLKAEFEMTNNFSDQASLNQTLAEVETTTTELLASLREVDKK